MKKLINYFGFFSLVTFKNIYFLSKKASYTIIKIAISIKIKTGRTSKKPIIEDLVRVVARPIRKDIASAEPNNVVILFIIIFTIFF